MLIWFGEDILTFCRNRIQSGCKSYVQLCDIPGYHANIFFISYIEIRLFSKYPGLRCPEHLMISGILVKKLMMDFLSSEYYSNSYFAFLKEFPRFHLRNCVLFRFLLDVISYCKIEEDLLDFRIGTS